MGLSIPLSVSVINLSNDSMILLILELSHRCKYLFNLLIWDLNTLIYAERWVI